VVFDCASDAASVWAGPRRVAGALEFHRRLDGEPARSLGGAFVMLTRRAPIKHWPPPEGWSTTQVLFAAARDLSRAS